MGIPSRLLAIILLITSAAQAAEPSYARVRLDDIPHVQQRPDFCGEACAEMFLTKLGKKWTQDQVFNESQLSAALGRGCHTAELNRALRGIGFDTGPVWHAIETAKHAEQIEAQWSGLHADLLRGIPSIICMYTREGPGATEHFRLILGYEPKADEVIYHEPAEAKGAYRAMPRKTYLSLWPLRKDAKSQMAIRMRLEPTRALRDAPPAAAGFTPADYVQHVMRLKEKLPKGFSVVIQPPFVVIGDEPIERVRQHASRTVDWSVQRLKKQYFSKDPADILDVWLFKDEESYKKHNKSIFNTEPGTPYGYYSSVEKALVMNISTGGGTLVHEIVHPFMHANFPACPAWFNEGMGSLYEQCHDQGGRIMGATNWRLKGLQQAIQNKKVPSFKDLTATTHDEFYNEDPGTNYSQSRYLCYYLQEQGLLGTYYEQFLTNHKTDPTGYDTLIKVLGEKDIPAFQKRWEAFVLKLKFPPA